jgi:hypothetical protein
MFFAYILNFYSGAYGNNRYHEKYEVQWEDNDMIYVYFKVPLQLAFTSMAEKAMKIVFCLSGHVI